MRHIYILLILISTLLPAQSQFQDFIDYVNSLPDPTAKAAAVDSFMIYARTVGIPFIEDSTTNFIYRGSGSSVSTAGDFNDWDPNNGLMTKLTQTNFWYKTNTFDLDARLDYKFVLDGTNWILDPENPRTCEGGYGPNSELAMPLYISPWEIVYRANIPHGTIINKVVFSPIMNSNYQLYIYLPPGYDSLSSTVYPTVYFQDGTDYINFGKAINVLDNLLDSGKISPVIGVFVKPNNRNEEYAGSLRNQYRQAFVYELVYLIDSLYKTKQQPDERLVIGDSFGGNISALISYLHPDVVGLCGLQSAAFWPNNYEAYNLIITGLVVNVKWSSIWGKYESLYFNMRAFRDFMIPAGYQFDWMERPEGHSWGLWRATLDRTLEYFFPANPTGIADEEFSNPEVFLLGQNYPNPFNPSTTITYSVSTTDRVTIKVFNIQGIEEETIVDKVLSPGNYQVEWKPANLPNGVYFYRMQAGGYFETKKMIFLK